MHQGDIFLILKQQLAHFFSFYQNPSYDKLCIVSDKIKIFIFATTLLTAVSIRSVAQNHKDTSNAQNKSVALARAVNSYSDAIGKHSNIFTGIYYNDSYIGIKDHPYYNENTWTMGNIGYDNQKYDSILIKYDAYKDLLLVKYIDKLGYIRPVQLYSAKVENFEISGHQFFYLASDSLPDYISGFFDMLHSGNYASVLAKRRKEINQTNTLTSLESRFVSKDRLYVQIGQSFYEIKKRKSILEVLSDRKSEIKTFLKRNKSRFKNDHEKELIEAVKYYNSFLNINGS